MNPRILGCEGDFSRSRVRVVRLCDGAAARGEAGAAVARVAARRDAERAEDRAAELGGAAGRERAPARALARRRRPRLQDRRRRGARRRRRAAARCRRRASPRRSRSLCKVGERDARARRSPSPTRRRCPSPTRTRAVSRCSSCASSTRPWKTPVGRDVARARHARPEARASSARVVLPAFPFDRTGTRDAVGLGLWVVIAIPEGVNYYQAVSWIRSDADVYAESYLPEDAALPARPRRRRTGPRSCAR